MPHPPLSKIEALKLITPVIDGEASADEKQSLIICMNEYPKVKQKIKSANKVKILIQTRCPKMKAPASLCQRILAFLGKDGSLEGTFY